MFQDFSKPFLTGFGSYDELVTIQTRMIETLATNQLECSKKCFDLHMQQTQKLRDCKDPVEAMALQQEYLQTIQNVLATVNASNMESLQKAAGDISKLAPEQDFKFPYNGSL